MAKSIVSAVLEKLSSLLMIPGEIKHNFELALALEEGMGKVIAHFQDIQSVLQDAESKQLFVKFEFQSELMCITGEELCFKASYMGCHWQEGR
ncbi:uncharacterized protein [Gossypium hirsutum]|uniref:Uncharacterized protein isoform X2 n=1 Tax=Gossypium hirsutum TaxID=3635 RepID=A0ABM2YZ82_GOSHI|nr:uncharacterized protein LOC107895684 isoform X2 [Gossypium hirsutum]